ncbi:hypothetical protein [Mycolicibacterium pallens]|uniref:Scaffolding protein n=1 Tax=Mycolicibacterium pallens TaxID=370524 RepID=A0ABX8VAX0_9MYCO|nr:hypothetical protein [Mycolicibacterium pallens]QYL14939.1 hypothetical protein K0O64_17390 [Mycolicibacterium pallens]
MSDVNTGPDAPQVDETADSNTTPAETVENAPDAQPDDNADKTTDGDTFPREVVDKLRKENADWRTRVKAAEDEADKLARRLHTALVTATNRLENSADLPYDAKHLEDAEQLGAALDALLADRPYLAKRVVKGDAGQGNRGDAESGVNLLELLRGR